MERLVGLCSPRHSSRKTSPQSESHTVQVDLLPPETNVTFHDSSFFRREHKTLSSLFFQRKRKILPPPSQVRRDCEHAIERGDARLSTPDRPPPVFYEALGLVVKFGSDITCAEGQCLWFIGRYLGHEVSVPEIYGWVRDCGETFLYMELVKADTLQDRWPSLSEEDRISVCNDLRAMTSCWRNLKQDRMPPFVASIGRQGLRDVMFYDAFEYPAGPFPDLWNFHDWYARLAFRNAPELFSRNHPELGRLSDEKGIVFTHNDLHRSNILVTRSSSSGRARVVSIIDWHQSGWYPEDWEYFKAEMTTDLDDEWRTQYLPLILDPPDRNYYRGFHYVEWSIK